MIIDRNFRQRVYDLVHDSVFSKPIQKIDYSKQGILILVTKIKPQPNGTNKMVSTTTQKR